MKSTCSNTKRYIVLKSPKLSSKPLSKQGKVINMKCSGEKVASKYASSVYRKSGRKMKSVSLYRKGKVSKYGIFFKVKLGKVKFSAKLVSSKSAKKPRKTCPRGSRQSKTGKTCQSSKLVIKRKTVSLEKARRAMKSASKSLSAAKRQLNKSKKTLSKTKVGTKSRSYSKKIVSRRAAKVRRKNKTLLRLRKDVKKRAKSLRSSKKSLNV